MQRGFHFSPKTEKESQWRKKMMKKEVKVNEEQWPPAKKKKYILNWKEI
jgi:hypothetical protein